MNDYINAKLKIMTRQNKAGNDYKVLEIYMESNTGELIKVLDLYLKDHIASIINYLVSPTL